MAASTFLILPSIDGGEAILGRLSGAEYTARRVKASALSELTISNPIIIVPGQWVRTFETELPKAGRAQQMKMARYAKDDDIASHADTLHFALSDAQPPKLAIIETGLMDSLGEVLGGLKPKAAYADYDVVMGDTALLVIDRAVEPGLATLDLDWTEETLNQPTDVELVSLFAEGLAAGRGINLLQGEYRSRSGFDVPKIPTIRAGALAASALLAAFIWNAVQDRAALEQAQELRAKTAAEYLAATGTRAPTNPGLTAAKSLQSGPAESAGFLDLSSVLFAGLANFDDIRVDQLRYNSEAGTLQLRLIYPSFDAAARAEASIRQSGGELTTGGVREQNGAFVGEATLKLGAGT